MPAPILRNITNDDLSARFVSTQTIATSPVDDTETVIATLAIPDSGNLAVVSGIRLVGWAAFTVGTSGDGVNLKIRQTNVSGSTIVATGLVTAVATDLDEITVAGFDPSPGKTAYALTMTVHAGGAVSTVSALQLAAIVI